MKRLRTKPNKALIEVYREMDDTQDHVCHNCGTTVNLSHSHLISRRYKNTECDPDNIVYHCMSIGGRKGCHESWESLTDRVFMNDFIENMEYIKEANYDLFRQDIVKLFELYGELDMNVENFSYICHEYQKL